MTEHDETAADQDILLADRPALCARLDEKNGTLATDTNARDPR
ncbi:hypothetical protein ABGB14_46905 [Nonomuraea sp. B10E15]